VGGRGGGGTEGGGSPHFEKKRHCVFSRRGVLEGLARSSTARGALPERARLASVFLKKTAPKMIEERREPAEIPSGKVGKGLFARKGISTRGGRKKTVGGGSFVGPWGRA